MRRAHAYKNLFICLGLGVVCCARAADVDIAQQAREIEKRQNERAQTQRELQINEQLERQRTGTVIDVGKPTEETDNIKDECRAIHQIRILPKIQSEHNTRLDQTWRALQSEAELFKDMHKDCLSVGNIIDLQNKLASTLLEKGYITSRVVVPDQNLNAGMLDFEMQVGVVGQIQSQGRQIGELGMLMPNWQGRQYNQRDADQALENLKRLPSQSAVQIQLAPAEQYNTRTLNYQLPEVMFKDRVNGSIGIDNSGNDGSGKYQTNATIGIDSPLGLYDSLTLNLGSNANMNATGYNNRSYGVYWELPIGYNSIQLAASQNTYKRTSPGYGRTDVKNQGKGSERSITFNRVLYRDTNNTNSVSLKLAQSKNNLYVDGNDLDVERRNYLYTQLGVSHRYYRGAQQYGLNLNYKSNILGETRNGEHQWSNQFHVWTGSLSADLPLQIKQTELNYSANLKMQYSSRDVPASEMYSIGSRYNIRGTDESFSLMAEDGMQLRNELSYYWWTQSQSAHQIYTTLDWGVVHGPSVQYANAGQTGRSIVGSTVGLRGQYHSLNYDIAVGRALHQPNERSQHGIALTSSINWRF